MDDRRKVADLDELPTNGSRVIVEIDGVEVAVFRYQDEFYALANYCIHQGGPLCEGELRGRMEIGDDGWEWRYDRAEKNVHCPWHGWRFDITTGRSVDDERYAVPSYDVEIEGESIYVSR